MDTLSDWFGALALLVSLIALGIAVTSWQGMAAVRRRSHWHTNQPGAPEWNEPGTDEPVA
jgi:hypothetical protein